MIATTRKLTTSKSPARGSFDLFRVRLLVLAREELSDPIIPAPPITTLKLIKTTTLVYNDGKRSDKVYIVNLVQVGAEYYVKAQHGKRGGTLRDVEISKSPMFLWTAEALFANQVAAKRKKGYSELSTPKLVHNNVVQFDKWTPRKIQN